MAKTKYKFSHRAGGKYYWTRPAGNGYEEHVFCDVLWFWNWRTDDTTLPRCMCEKRGFWGATGMMPDDNHVLVVTKNRQYLAHRHQDGCKLTKDHDGKCCTCGSMGACKFWCASKDDEDMCMSRGPRIGDDGQPVCKREKGHLGLHRPRPDDGWGPGMAWGGPW